MRKNTIIDKKDRRLLIELEYSCRQTHKTIGRKVGLSSDIVRYRIHRLVRLGVIRNFLTYINFCRLGFTDYGVFFSVQHMTFRQEADLKNYLTSHSSISYLARLGGQYDYVMGILARNIAHFNDILSTILQQIGPIVLSKVITIRVSLTHFPKTYLLNTHLQREPREEKPTPYFGNEFTNEEIDETDFEILSAMATKATASTLELSKALGIPASTIAVRLKKLIQRKIIVGFFAFTSAQSYGFQAYNIMLRVKNLSKPKERQLTTFFASHPNIVYTIKTVGAWDFEVAVEVPDQQVFQRVLGEIREQFFDIIQQLEFVTVFQELKYNVFPFSKTDFSYNSGAQYQTF